MQTFIYSFELPQAMNGNQMTVRSMPELHARDPRRGTGAFRVSWTPRNSHSFTSPGNPQMIHARREELADDTPHLAVESPASRSTWNIT